VTASSYLATLPFSPDRFQVEAAGAIDAGESVVVTAPTGSGKTVVAEAAIHRAVEAGLRAIYTTPLKALSNQKFGDFSASYGPDRVGLLTGDNSINGSAPVVVMTTEVLRNMMYEESPDLADVGVVVLDEVHYLADRSRGAVWEEIIVHLDRSIPLVCLSATVANAEELRDWIADRRGPTSLVVERERPVPLESLYLLRDRWEKHHLRLLPVFHGSRPNDRIARMLRPGKGGAQRYASPRRHETCALLEREGLLPAIYFIFSRAGCDAAASQVVDRGLRLTTAAQADRVQEMADAATAHLGPTDLKVLGYDRFVHNLRAGVAPHHAGMVPALKEVVERLFAEGPVQLVFATETLALGINMPARTVVLESLSKFTGEGHELLQPGDYTQLTGRAGRRGIDTSGTAVVLHSQYVPFERVAGIAARGSHALRSSFRPTYNMVVNLIARYDRDEAERLLNSSFAQFADQRRRRQLESDVAADRARVERLQAEAEHPEVDVWEVLDSTAEDGTERVLAFVSRTFPGDVLQWHRRGRTRRHVVVARGTGKRPRLLAISEEGELARIDGARLPDTVQRLGRLDIEGPLRPRDRSFREEVAARLRDWLPEGLPEQALSEALEGLPAGFEENLEAARTVRRLEARIADGLRSAAALGPGLVPRLRAIVGLLERWGYADGWSLTPRGERLRTVYNELDLLLTECLAAGLFGDLDPRATAALASAFVFEPRGDAEPGRWPPGLTAVGDTVESIWERLVADEAASGLPPSRQPDPGFAAAAVAWAEGAGLDDLFDEDAAGVGDFVRTTRQLIDLLRQIRDTAPDLAPGAARAAQLIDRGVVAAAGAV